MRVEVSLLSTSQPIVHVNIENAYVKDGLYCIYDKETKLVYKYPISNIFRAVETYT